MRALIVTSVVTQLLLTVGQVWADYTVVLKNGRRLTIENYREDAGVIRFRGLGGEIAIPRDQIESIQDTGSGATGFSVPTRSEPPTAQPSQPTLNPNLAPKLVEQAPGKQKTDEARAREEKEYQEKLKALTEKLKQLREQYAAATRGNTGSEPNLFTSEEAFRGHQQDLLSRLKDAQNNPGPAPDAGPEYLVTSATEGRAPQTREVRLPARTEPIGPPPIESYTPQEKLLSNLRRDIADTQKERQQLIDEMKAKNFDTGSLFLE
jgi:uncharacterized coiled-coil protein SlyX